MKNRKLDIELAQRLGWKLTQVSKDIDGKNECQILTETGYLPSDVDLPRKGKIDIGYLVPNWSSNLESAIVLARSLGKIAIRIDHNVWDLPEIICQDILKELKQK